MKKLLALVVAAVGGALAWKKVTADRNAEADLWAEATDRVDPAGHPVDPHRVRAPTGAHRGDVAQLAEHRLCKAGVEGSSPFVSTAF